MIAEKAIFLLTLATMVLTPNILIGAEVTLPSVDLGGNAFLDGVVGTGLMFKERIQYYAAEFKNSKGGTIPGNNSGGTEDRVLRKPEPDVHQVRKA